VRRSTLVAAWVLGLIAVAFLVVMGIAGVSGATALLVAGAGIIVMVALGGIVGGRNTSRKTAPRALPGGVAPSPLTPQPSSPQPSGAPPSGAQPSGARPSGARPSGARPSGAQPSSPQPSGVQPSAPRSASAPEGGDA
jgi:hypothetical protein